MSIISLVLLIRPWMRVMFRLRRMMLAVIRPLIVWTTIHAMRRELLHMMQTLIVTMIIVMRALGLIAVRVLNVRGQPLFVLAVTVFSVLWMPIAGFA